MVAVALELEHAVDQVLEHARAGDRAVLGHMADEDGRDPGLLRHAQQPPGRLAHLRDRAGRRADVGRVERLDGVDHAHGGPLLLERRRRPSSSSRLGQDLDLPRAAEPRRAQLDLRDGFLAGDEERAPRLTHRAQRGQQQRRLADAGLTADEDERGGDQPAAEDAVELGDAGRDPLGLVDLDVHQPQERTCGRLPRGLGRLLGKRPERAAPGALSEPAPGGVSALRARIHDRSLGHAATLWRRPDGFVPTLCQPASSGSGGGGARRPSEAMTSPARMQAAPTSCSAEGYSPG